MAKVIVERPRYGSRVKARHKKGYRRYVQKHGAENLPRREPMLGRWRGMQRSLNEHLGPMRRFLRSRVGQPWNKVHQELCEHVALDNPVQNHVLSHIFQYVERHVEIRGDRVVYGAGWWGGYPLRVGKLYVCPVSGILRAVRAPKRRGAPKRICGGAGNQLLSTEKWLREIANDGHGVQYHRRENWWWQVHLRKLPADRRGRWDVWLDRPLTSLSKEDCISAYGSEMFATSKRPLTREESRELYRRIRAQRNGSR